MSHTLWSWADPGFQKQTRQHRARQSAIRAIRSGERPTYRVLLAVDGRWYILGYRGWSSVRSTPWGLPRLNGVGCRWWLDGSRGSRADQESWPRGGPHRL